MEDLKWLYTLATASTLLFISLYLVSKNRKKHQKPMAPSPPSLPIIGHLHLLKKPLHRTFDTLASKYGPIFGLKLGIQYAVVVSSPAGYEECFRKNDVVLADRPQVLSAKYLNWDSSTMGASNFGDHWKNMRRICNQELYSGTRLNMFVSARQDEVVTLIKSLFSTTKEGKKKVEMKPRVIESTFRTLARMVTGRKYYDDGADDPVGKEFRKIIREITRLSDVSNIADFIPILRYTKFGGYEKEMAIVHRRTDAVIQALIEEVKAKDGVDSALRTLLAMHEANPKSIALKTIKGLVQEMITAGTDATSATVEWAMCLLLNNPEKLKKAQAELDTVIGNNRLVEEADLTKLPYMQAIIKETMRLYPGAPLLVPHTSSGECTILGYHIPQGSMVLVSAWFIHRDPNVWDEPLSFKPERFENVDEFSLTYKFLPFGIGRRSCPGAALSNKVIALAVAALVQCFEWERIGEEKIDMREGEGLTMPKLKSLEAMCEPRKSMVNVLLGL